MSTPTAAFAFKAYSFSDVELHMDLFDEKGSLDLNFAPSGEYYAKEGLYMLHFVFTANHGEEERSLIKIVCNAVFEFKQPLDITEIPDYFFPNSLAIVFPYVRAFVSTVTLQANLSAPILIPTLNLTSLQSVLKANTLAK